ncbi:putative metal-dependent hydrolase [Desulfocapsa sulfexigens DSM 10523]|uniref:Putative metal-dependent hydrolase n=1 Tax=Desulfocapsa sulfexigens (strain DSM 10523 / SB164P1) TaxID=1167006 RepID=M1NA69_DESSD|nr:putative metal-dependent hydrolase [Desulfocapsa sulfexigens DSM 10523]
MEEKRLNKEYIVINDLPVEVWRKSVKNINLAVYAPDGRVRISVPHRTSDKRLRQAVTNRIPWIQKQREHFRTRPVAIVLKAVTGEMHPFFGGKYPLTVVENSARHYVSFDSLVGITLHIRPGTTSKMRLTVLETWYREELKRRIPALLAKWQPQVGRRAKEFRIKKMKTRWGTCNVMAGRLWLNLELAKKPDACLELIVVHELVHLLERDHNKEFYGHMDRLLPEWRDTDMVLRNFK